MGHRVGSPIHQRQAGLRSVEGLDLALLFGQQQHRVRRRIYAKVDDVAQSRHESGSLASVNWRNLRHQAVCPYMRCTEGTLMPAALAIADEVR
jgi:hypothetical protein